MILHILELICEIDGISEGVGVLRDGLALESVWLESLT